MDVLAALLLSVMISTLPAQSMFNSPKEFLLKKKIWKFFKNVLNHENYFSVPSVMSVKFHNKRVLLFIRYKIYRLSGLTCFIF